MTVELTDDEAREIADLLRTAEHQLIAEFATGTVDVGDTETGKWANRLEERAGDDA